MVFREVPLDTKLFPNVFSDYFGNKYLCDTKRIRDGLLRSRAVSINFSDLLNVTTGKFSCGVSFTRVRDTGSNCSSPLSSHVSHIFGVGSQKQMIRSDAFTVIAAVADFFVGGNLSKVKFPGDSMGTYLILSKRSRRSLASRFVDKRQSPVSSILQASYPLPTTLGFMDLRPEPFAKTSNDHLNTLPLTVGGVN